MTSARVLVVDDSVVVRRAVSRAVDREPELTVCGVAASGPLALAKIATTRPDVVVLDVTMPGMDGFDTLSALRERCPDLPVVMFSVRMKDEREARDEAMRRGATACVAKLEGGLEAAVRELVATVKCAGRTGPPRPSGFDRTRPRVLAIAASTGGPRALVALLQNLRPLPPIPVVITQHMPPLFTARLARRLRDDLALDAHEGREGAKIGGGQVWLAPGGRHMLLARRGTEVRLSLSDAPPLHGCRPAADPMLDSVVRCYGAGTLTVVLSGMGRDALAGCRGVVDAGGAVLVQDEESAVVWSMPGHVARAGLADQCLDPAALADEVRRRTTPEADTTQEGA